MLQGHCTAMTEYTGTAHVVDDPTPVQGRGQDRLRRHPEAGEERPGHRHVHLRHRVGRAEHGRRGQVPRVVHVEQGAEGVRAAAAARPSPGSALRDPTLSKKYRWLPAIADAVDNSIPKPRHPDEPKMEDLLGTAAERGPGGGDHARSRAITQIAQSHLTAAANQITAYLKQQGTTSRPCDGASSAKRRRRGRGTAGRGLPPARTCCCVPAAVALAGVSLYPLFYGVRASFTHYLYGRDFGFDGLTNYRDAWNDPFFRQAMVTTAKYVVVAVTIETAARARPGAAGVARDPLRQPDPGRADPADDDRARWSSASCGG